MQRPATLQGTLLAFATGLGALAVGAMIFTAYMTTTAARELAARGREAMVEERIADRLVEATHAQRAAAFLFIQSREPAAAEEFRARGREFYAAVREYLFLALPLRARLRVERVREAHERFEVVALRAFELAREDERPGFSGIVRQADILSGELRQFQAMRDHDQAEFTAMREARMARLQQGSVVLALLVAAAVMAGVLLLRRIVLRPLGDFERAARRLGEGDDTAQVPPQSFAEFAMAAESFNQMAARLHRTRRDLIQHEKLSAMGEMLAGLAHELNNPLAAILASAEVLEVELAEGAKRGADADVAVDMAAQLSREARRARALVRNLLNLSRRSEGEVQRVDVGAIIREAVMLREPAFARAGKAIEVPVPDPVYAMVEATRLEVALVNLLNNALDALSECGSGVTVSAYRVADPAAAAPGGATHWIEISVTDDGPGLTDPDRIFEPFYTTKPVGKGTGLGLALVHRFVHDMGGSVRAVNGETGGASIVLRLPEAPRLESPATGGAVLREDAPPAPSDRAPLDALEVASPGARITTGAAPLNVAPAPLAAHGRRPRVLVVDDEAAMRRVQARVLERMGVDVRLADSATAAQRLLLREPVDLVISDLKMPGEMDGLGLVQWMRRERPRLAESAFIMTGDIQMAGISEVGIPSDRVLGKPFDLADYVERVGRALSSATGPVPD